MTYTLGKESFFRPSFMPRQTDIENKLRTDFADLYDWIGSLENELAQCRSNELKFIESQERYRSLVEGALDAIFEVDENGYIIDCNTAATHLFQYRADEFHNMRYPQLFVQSYHVDLSHGKSRRAHATASELWCMRKDGSMFPAEVHNLYQEFGDSKRLLFYIRDVSEHKKSELLLTSQNRILEFIARGQPVDQILDAIVVMVEASVDKSMCVIHSYNPVSKELGDVRFVRMPANFKHFGKITPGHRNGSMGLAVLKRETVFSHNLRNDPIWQNFRNEVKELGLYSSVSSPIILSNGDLVGVLSVFNFDPEKYTTQLRKPLDVAVHLSGIAIERQRSQSELNMRKAWYKTLFESTHDAIFIFKNRTCIDCNRRATEILRAQREDIIGHNTIDYSPELQPDGLPSTGRADQLLGQVLNGHALIFNWVLIRKDGEHFNADINLQPVAVNGETFIKITMRDLKEQPGFQRVDSDVDDIWKPAFEGSHDGLVLVGHSGEILKVNLVAARMMGYSSDEIIGRKWEKLLNQISTLRDRQDVSDQFEVRLLQSKNGESTTIAITRPDKRSKNNDDLQLVVMRDIERYDESQRYLLELEQRYRSILGNVPMTMVTLDEHNKVSFVEGKGFEIFDIPTEDVLGKQAEELFGELTIKLESNAKVPFTQIIPEVRNGNTFSGLVKINDHYFDTRLLPNVDHKGIFRGTIVVGMNVTEWHQTKEQLEHHQQMFEQLVERSPVGIVMLDKEHHVQMVNPAFQDIFGYTESDILGKNLDELIVSDYLKKEAKRISSGSYSGATIQKESVRLHKNGQKIPVIIYGFPVNINGEPISIFGLYVDISDRKNAENKLRKSLEEKDVLMAEIHHRVKNNLAVISSLLELTVQNEEDEGIKKKLLDSELRLKTIALIHEKLYHSENLSNISFDHYIRELISGISKKMGSEAPKIRVFYELDAVDLNINQGIPAALIVNELVTNVYKHAFKRRNKGVLRIYMSQIKNWITLCIRDNGSGFVYSPKTSCNEKLGIKLINMLTEQLQGNVDFDTEEGTSCTVKFKLEN